MYEGFYLSVVFHNKLNNKKMEKKEQKTKKSWLKNQVAKVRILPWYWKLVTTAVLSVGGVASVLQLYTGSSDLGMVAAIVIAVIILWVLAQMWIPTSQK